MASITLGQYQRQKRNGTSAVIVRISHLGTNAFINTGVYIDSANFDANNLREPINRKAYLADLKNEQIGAIVRKFDEVIFELGRSDEIDLSNLTATDIRNYVVGEKKCKRKRLLKAGRKHANFMAWFQQYGESRATENTRKHYAYIYRILMRYCNAEGIEQLSFEDIDYQRLNDIKAWIRANSGESTRYKADSYIRAAYREAQRCKLVSKEEDPWEDYKVERVKAPEEIDYAPIDDIRRLLAIDLRGHIGEKNLTMARDVVLLSWYLCGANLIDIYNMPLPKGNEFVFVRHKLQTRDGRPIHIRIEPELQTLLDRYRGEQLAFCFQEQVPTWETFQRRMADRLHRLEQLTGISVRLSKVRRSWATYAANMDFSERTIDRSMGHVDNTILGRHYAAYDWGKTAQCNRTMIDLLWKGVKENSIPLTTQP